jgi:hypothetical protein
MGENMSGGFKMLSPPMPVICSSIGQSQ